MFILKQMWKIHQEEEQILAILQCCQKVLAGYTSGLALGEVVRVLPYYEHCSLVAVIRLAKPLGKQDVHSMCPFFNKLPYFCHCFPLVLLDCYCRKKKYATGYDFTPHRDKNISFPLLLYTTRNVYVQCSRILMIMKTQMEGRGVELQKQNGQSCHPKMWVGLE